MRDGQEGEESAQAGQRGVLLESYARAFSHIESLQREHLIRYELWRSGESLRMEIGESGGGAVRCAMPHSTESWGRRLLQYLYENAATPEQSANILEDLCGPGN